MDHWSPHIQMLTTHYINKRRGQNQAPGKMHGQQFSRHLMPAWTKCPQMALWAWHGNSSNYIANQYQQPTRTNCLMNCALCDVYNSRRVYNMYVVQYQLNIAIDWSTWGRHLDCSLFICVEGTCLNQPHNKLCKFIGRPAPPPPRAK